MELQSPSPADNASVRQTSLSSEQKLQAARTRIGGLSKLRQDRLAKKQRVQKRLEEIQEYLDVSESVSEALEQLSNSLFEQQLGVVQEKLTVGLQEILEQPVTFRAKPDVKRGAATVEFSIERNGKAEDVLKGQGGSVANILSVGLRIFALTTLDPAQHRRFLVLDEQDCWLHPDLVPRMVKMVHEAAEALGFQVLMISHHDGRYFERWADRIYRLSLNSEGHVTTEMVFDKPNEIGQEENLR